MANSQNRLVAGDGVLWRACQFVRVRVFVREHISETTRPTFTSLCARWPIPSTVAHGNGCDTLCTSGCIDDVMGGHTRACQYRCSEWRHRVVVRRLTPPLRRIGRVLSQTTADAEAGQVYRAGLGLKISRYVTGRVEYEEQISLFAQLHAQSRLHSLFLPTGKTHSINVAV